MKKTTAIQILLVIICLGTSNVQAVDYTGSGTYTIDEMVNDNVRIYDNTTVNLVSGGSVGDPANPTGTLDLNAYDNSWVNMSGGWIDHNLYGFHYSHLNISGGTINRSLLALYNSDVIISGGEILLNTYLEDDTTVDISGGSFGGDVFVRDNSIVNISGGLFAGDIRVVDNSIMYIYGTEFKIDDISVGYGDVYDIFGDYTGTLTGTLSGGETLNSYFQMGMPAFDGPGWNKLPGSIVLVPEPATVLIFGMGGLLLRKRRKN